MKRLVDKSLGFAAFRTYAISGHQVVPALLVLLLGLAQLGGYYIVSTYVLRHHMSVTHLCAVWICRNVIRIRHSRRQLSSL